MKRLLTLAAMFLCCMATTFAQFSGSGSGTENDPYLILNPIQLSQMRNFSGNSNVYFKLMADIDLSDYIDDEYGSQGWLPISSFYGFFDGNGKTIVGLRINRPNMDYVGLFSSSRGFRIQNLTIKDADIRGNENVGLIVGYLYGGNISNCVLSGKIEGKTYVGGCIGGSNEDDRKTPQITNINSSLNIVGGNYTGGIIGKHFSDFGVNIQFCNFDKSKITGSNYVGGIFGQGTGTIQNAFVYSDIIGNNNVGGISGYGGTITSCGFWGVLQASSSVGGISGASSSINNCCVIGKIECEENNAGGIIGSSSGNIKNNYFNGGIIGQENIGGIVGAVNSHSIISNCISNATISGTQKVGGIAGKVMGYQYNSVVTKLYSNIAILNSINASVKDAGRIYGNTSGYVIYGTMGSSQENKALNRAIVIEAGIAKEVTDGDKNGTGTSPTTLKLKATYIAMGYDFNDIWEIQETECYPYFKSQTAPPVITSQVVSGATTISGKCVDGGTVTLEVDGVKQQKVSSNHEFSFTVSPLQAGHEVRVCAKAEGKEQSYFTTEVVSYLGKGTEDDPYQVYTASDLTGVYRKGYFKLMNDIDLTSYINQFSPTEGWESIGREGSETIHFDGNGHKITGLWCNSTRDNTGLFSCFANGTIKNLTIETANGKQVKGGANTGILIGKMINGTIENCQVSGILADGTPVGGLVGLFDGGKISLSQATVTINTTNGTSYVGGLVGEITGGEIDQCVTQGTITATGNESYAGGLIGKNSSTVTNSYSNVKVTSSYNAAGLVAYNYGVVDKCYATGDLFSNNYGAGVIGYNDGANAVVKNCVAMNNKINVTWESQQQQQGGGYGQRIIGGIKNGAPAPELNNYALKTMQVSVNNVAQKVYDDIMNGVGKNASDLLQASTYQELGWNFTDTWTINENENYPLLKNNVASVVKPDGPDEPDTPVTTDDKLTVAEVKTSAGKTVTVPINLENKTTNLSAYQFDLTLPTGFTLATNDNGKYLVTKTNRYEDESQSLTASLLEGNTYRFVCFSLSNGIIEGTSGAILNALIAVDNNVAAGTYQAKIENIIFTKTDGTQLRSSDITFNFVVSNILMGDANGDGEVNVADIVEIVNDILGKPSEKFVRAAANMNGDDEINVTDIVMVVNIILSGNTNCPSLQNVSDDLSNGDYLTLEGNDDGSLSFNMERKDSYVASQFDLRLAEGQKLEGISLNRKHSSQHLLTYKEVERNLYRVVTYSLNNNSYVGNQGELLNIQVSGNGSVEIDNILFITDKQAEKRFAPLNVNNTTDIRTVLTDLQQDVYTIDGRLVRRQATSTDGLAKGVYIINGKKQVVR